MMFCPGSYDRVYTCSCTACGTGTPASAVYRQTHSSSQCSQVCSVVWDTSTLRNTKQHGIAASYTLMPTWYSSRKSVYCRMKLFCKLIIFVIKSFTNIVNSHLFSLYLYITKAEPLERKIANILLHAKSQIFSTHKNSVPPHLVFYSTVI